MPTSAVRDCAQCTRGSAVVSPFCRPFVMDKKHRVVFTVAIVHNSYRECFWLVWWHTFCLLCTYSSGGIFPLLTLEDFFIIFKTFKQLVKSPKLKCGYGSPFICPSNKSNYRPLQRKTSLAYSQKHFFPCAPHLHQLVNTFSRLSGVPTVLLRLPLKWQKHKNKEL